MTDACDLATLLEHWDKSKQLNFFRFLAIPSHQHLDATYLSAAGADLGLLDQPDFTSIECHSYGAFYKYLKYIELPTLPLSSLASMLMSPVFYQKVAVAVTY